MARPSYEQTWASDDPPGDSPAGRGPDEPELADRIGRYLLSSRVGSGSMGVVFSAWDPELERRVALKFIDLANYDAVARLRVMREAQAMARLDHPNVVAIHDVGEHAGRIYLVMAFVEGQTLSEWLREAPRGWREILEVFVQAGRGLAAAHAAGLVHRDFKLDNVMIDGRGHAQVLDFGLARAHGGPAQDETERARPDQDRSAPSSPSAGELSGTLDTSVTRHGALIGTPAYMAPELFAGRPADARSDQFALCVALYKALYDQRPYGEDSLASLIDAMKHEQLRPAPRGARVPAQVHAIVARGLARAPEQRWPSVAELVRALEDDPARLRARLLSLAFAALAGLSAALAVHHEPALAPCQGSAAQLAQIWNEARRASLGARFEAAGSAWSSLARAQLDARLDAYSGAWVDAHREACEATRVRGELSERVLDQRMRCLAHGRRELELLVEVLEQGDEHTLERAVAAAEGLPELEHCADLEALERLEHERLGVGEVAALELFGAHLDRVEVLLRTAELERAQTELEAMEALPAFATLEHLPTRAAYRHARGRLLSEQADYEGAAAALDDAFHMALRAALRPRAAQIATDLSLIVGERLADYEQGWRWLRLAESLAPEQPLARAQLLERRAMLTYRSGAFTDALEVYREGIELLERAREPSSTLAALYNGAGLCHMRLGQTEQARAPLQRAVELMGQTLGPDHPKVAATLLNLAGAQAQAGELELSRRTYERAILVLEVEYGPEHPNLGVAHVNLAGIARRLGELELALDSGRRAQAIYAASFGPEHPKYAIALAVLSRVELERGELESAERHAREAVEIDRAKFGERDPRLARPMIALVRVLLARGHHADALELCEHSLELVGQDPFRADVVSERERLRRLSGLEPGPRADVDAALHVCEELVDCGGYDHGELLFARARLNASPADAREALTRLEPVERPPAERLRASIRAWLDERSAP